MKKAVRGKLIGELARQDGKRRIRRGGHFDRRVHTPTKYRRVPLEHAARQCPRDMSETKPTSGDATLDALVRDLSAKVKATDGRWVAENEPKEGAKSIYDDFEGAIADAPRGCWRTRRRRWSRAGPRSGRRSGRTILGD